MKVVTIEGLPNPNLATIEGCSNGTNYKLTYAKKNPSHFVLRIGELELANGIWTTIKSGDWVYDCTDAPESIDHVKELIKTAITKHDAEEAYEAVTQEETAPVEVPYNHILVGLTSLFVGWYIGSAIVNR
jgi:hypothetical protein